MPLGEQRTLLAVFAHPDDRIPPEVRWDFMGTECFSLPGSCLGPGQEPETDLFAAVRIG